MYAPGRLLIIKYPIKFKVGIYVPHLTYRSMYRYKAAMYATIIFNYSLTVDIKLTVKSPRPRSY